jgi:hypothetical protein
MKKETRDVERFIELERVECAECGRVKEEGDCYYTSCGFEVCSVRCSSKLRYRLTR